MLARIEFELTSHVRDMKIPVGNFHKLVMDPETGLVVKYRQLERAVGVVEANIKEILAERFGERVRHLEAESEAEKEKRKWGLREVIVPALVSIAIALLGFFLLRGAGS